MLGLRPWLLQKQPRIFQKYGGQCSYLFVFCPYSSGVAHSTYVGDDSATEIHLKTLASYAIEK